VNNQGPEAPGFSPSQGFGGLAFSIQTITFLINISEASFNAASACCFV